jgi:predicted ArsR family transcriptional regulator
MDLYDRKILAALRDGKSRNFQQILSKVEFSYNTLRLHLAQLVEHGLVVRRKKPQQGPGRPRFAYALPEGVDGRAVSALVDPYKGLVVLSFDRLRRICRHEKGGYCKEIRGRCAPQNCPQIIK